MKKIKNYIKNNKKEFIFIITLLILFTIISILVVTEKTSNIDSLMHSYILNIRSNNLTTILNTITNLAGASFLLALSCLLLIILKNKKIALYIFINLASAFAINETAKTIFTRSRPIGINLIEETGFSFPSGHSMISLSFYGFIAYLLSKNTKNKYQKITIITITTLIILTIGFSRIYLGVHYLSDIIAGFLLASIYLIIYIKLINLEKKWLIWKQSG